MAPISLDSPSPSSGNGQQVPTLANNYSTVPAAIDPTAARRPVEPITVDSPNLIYTDDALFAKYLHHSTTVKKDGDRYSVKPVATEFEFRTQRKVPKLGLVKFYFEMLVARFLIF